MDRFDIKRYNEPRRFLVRYYDTKKLYSKKSTFNSWNAAVIYIQGLKFIGSELEIWDSRNKKIIRKSKHE